MLRVRSSYSVCHTGAEHVHLVIERISDNRDPQPDFEAIYLLMPTSQNIDRIIEDFSGHRQYDGAHLFFIDGKATHVH